MKIKNIVGVIAIALVTSVVSSFATLSYVNSNDGSTKIGNNSSSTSANKIQVINDGSTKSQTVYQAVAQKASPSVVGIVTETVSTNAESIFGGDNKQTQSGSGTGIIVNSKGYILTNSHVVSDGQAKSVNVVLSNGSTSKGEVVWNDANLDLAIVKINKSGLTAAELGDSDSVKVGDIAIAIGNPLGTDLMTSVTQGIISGLNRDVTTSSGSMSGLIQTDASINPGNSGGPLLNQEGQVIGINTAKANADNLGFSIPINIAKQIVERVVENKNYEKPVLGISGLDVQKYEAYTGQDIGSDYGILIRTVQRGSIAEKAGIKSGDILVKIGYNKITNLGEISKKLYSYSKGSKDTIEVIRNGKTVKLDISF